MVGKSKLLMELFADIIRETMIVWNIHVDIAYNDLDYVEVASITSAA